MSAGNYYEKLPGVGAAFVGTGNKETLYLAPDHLLALQRGVAAESARRFQYRDIQALTCFKTNGGTYTSAALAAMLLVAAGLAGIAVISELPDGWMGIFSIIGVIFFLLLVWNVSRGPTCITTLYTGVNVRRLSSLRRYRKAEAAIARIAERVNGTQTALDPGQVAAHVEQQAQGGKPLIHVSRASGATHTQQFRTQPYFSGTGVHFAFFLLLVLLAASSILDYFMDNDFKNFLDAMLMLVILGVGIAAIYRQRNSDLGRTVRFATGVSFTVQIVTYYMVVTMMVVGGIVSGAMQAAANAESPGEAVLRLDDMPGAARLIFVTITLVSAAACAAWGLLALLVSQREAPSAADGPADDPA